MKTATEMYNIATVGDSNLKDAVAKSLDDVFDVLEKRLVEVSSDGLFDYTMFRDELVSIVEKNESITKLSPDAFAHAMEVLVGDLVDKLRDLGYYAKAVGHADSDVEINIGWYDPKDVA